MRLQALSIFKPFNSPLWIENLLWGLRRKLAFELGLPGLQQSKHRHHNTSAGASNLHVTIDEKAIHYTCAAACLHVKDLQQGPNLEHLFLVNS